MKRGRSVACSVTPTSRIPIAEVIGSFLCVKHARADGPKRFVVIGENSDALRHTASESVGEMGRGGTKGFEMVRLRIWANFDAV